MPHQVTLKLFFVAKSDAPKIILTKLLVAFNTYVLFCVFFLTLCVVNKTFIFSLQDPHSEDRDYTDIYNYHPRYSCMALCLSGCMQCGIIFLREGLLFHSALLTTVFCVSVNTKFYCKDKYYH